MKIDSHHHFWKYDPVTYSWMNEKMGVLKKDYQPEDLKTEINSSNIDGVVSVQADQSMRETDDLLKHANEHSFIKGVVGWFPLAEPELEELLERYASNPWLKGVRHVVQDEPDDRFILGDAFNAGIRKLKPYNLVYDILIYERQLGASIEFVIGTPDRSSFWIMWPNHASETSSSSLGKPRCSTWPNAIMFTASFPEWPPRPIGKVGPKRTSGLTSILPWRLLVPHE